MDGSFHQKPIGTAGDWVKMAATVLKRVIWIGASVLASSLMAAGCSRETPAAPDARLARAEMIAPAASDPATAPAEAMTPPVVKASAEAPGFAIQSVLQPDSPIGAGDYAWNSDGVPAGPILIAVDLGAQRLYAYRGGVEIGRSSILYGADDKPTPTGSFPILQKKRHHISNLYGAPMPYMLRLTMDGIAVHGSEVEDGSATHGCIGLPDEFAALLFEEVKVGDRVVIAKEWMREVYYPRQTPDRSA
jgi:lipoprotein-anchoring transpeptidase ErfK/SrfK